ncbi:uncharacterized protein EV420DRAFT_1556099 [Desarmillaria tabescens]|uniref:Secreted protein n=1 Tax=Armillaria tabescens TaxID=1929756 RepID=A0AA39K3M9_ARMTA|nr:uncharacterized protein EV420DRAFT_1556099 [Desarmillaria tabescens]KAK0453982.1 hypothetical protein EV420DRAFT_1556099 [Desarmillaria tabescens]
MWTIDLSLLLLLTTLLYLPQNSTTLTFSPPPAMAAVRQSCDSLVPLRYLFRDGGHSRSQGESRLPATFDAMICFDAAATRSLIPLP